MKWSLLNVQWDIGNQTSSFPVFLWIYVCCTFTKSRFKAFLQIWKFMELLNNQEIQDISSDLESATVKSLNHLIDTHSKDSTVSYSSRVTKNINAIFWYFTQCNVSNPSILNNDIFGHIIEIWSWSAYPLSHEIFVKGITWLMYFIWSFTTILRQCFWAIPQTYQLDSSNTFLQQTALYLQPLCTTGIKQSVLYSSSNKCQSTTCFWKQYYFLHSR